MEHSWKQTIRIDRPVEEVYAYLADFPRHAEWAQTVVQLEKISGGTGAGVGTRYKTTERQAFQADRKPREALTRGMKATTVCEITELVPNRRIAWRANPRPKMGIQANLSFDLAPADGGTDLTQSIRMQQGRFGAFVGKYIFRATPAKAEAQYAASLRNIKTILEEGASAAPQATPGRVAV
jgi:uncharacterized membrane protein